MCLKGKVICFGPNIVEKIASKLNRIKIVYKPKLNDYNCTLVLPIIKYVQSSEFAGVDHMSKMPHTLSRVLCLVEKL